MPDGFIDIPPLTGRDLKHGTAIRIAENVMAPLTVLAGGTVVLAGMVLWGVWTAACRAIRPLLYTLAGMALVALVLLIGGVAGYAYHAYQIAGGKPIAGQADMLPPSSELPPLPALPPQSQAPVQAPPAPPQTDPFGLKP
jgi:hypothetical protein